MGVRTDLSRCCAMFLLVATAFAAMVTPLYAVDPQLASTVAAVPSQEDNLLGGLPPYLPKAPISAPPNRAPRDANFSPRNCCSAYPAVVGDA